MHRCKQTPQKRDRKRTTQNEKKNIRLQNTPITVC